MEMNTPIIVMIFLQVIYASITLSSRVALVQHMSPRVFVVYRQAIATFIIVPIALFSRRKNTSRCQLGWRTFLMIFLASTIGVTLNQNLYFEGLYLSSSAMGSAMGNLVPAITFVIAYFVGIEKVYIRRVRSMAKVFGTVICVAGAVSMAMLKGPKLLNMEFNGNKSLFNFSTGDDMWLIGCLLLFASSVAWSIWLIVQVPISVAYPDPLSFTAWMCFIGAIQAVIVTFFLEKDLNAWKLHSYLELISCAFAALGSVISFFGQAWCISRKGPLFSAMFSPLSTVMVIIYGSMFMDEKMYLGGLLGALAVICGLYIVLWGKAKDLEEKNDEKIEEKANDQTNLGDEFSDIEKCKVDLEQPLLSDDLREK